MNTSLETQKVGTSAKASAIPSSPNQTPRQKESPQRMLYSWNGTAESYTQDRCRTVCYLSDEFLMGPHLGNNLISMGIYEQVKAAMESLGLDFNELLAQEVEPGLGNGGLGRLAACYLDSLAPLYITSLGNAKRNEIGLLEQGQQT